MTNVVNFTGTPTETTARLMVESQKKRAEVERTKTAVLHGLAWAAAYHETMGEPQDALNFLRLVEYSAKKLRAELEGKP